MEFNMYTHTRGNLDLRRLISNTRFLFYLLAIYKQWCLLLSYMCRLQCPASALMLFDIFPLITLKSCHTNLLPYKLKKEKKKEGGWREREKKKQILWLWAAYLHPQSAADDWTMETA